MLKKYCKLKVMSDVKQTWFNVDEEIPQNINKHPIFKHVTSVETETSPLKRELAVMHPPVTSDRTIR